MNVNQKWSIGLYHGDSPFTLKPIKSNPIIQASDISDLNADFIADPFMIYHDNCWFLFFETLPENNTNKGVIGCAKSNDMLHWSYHGTVLTEDYHLSYPYIFKYEGEVYMLPETLGANAVTLYKAEHFPDQWHAVAELLPGQHADPSLFYYQDHWWLFTCPTPEKHDSLKLYFADNLTGPWQAHPDNPIIKQNDRCARPAGRVIKWQNKLYRFAQDCQPRYGTQVRAFEIQLLTPFDYLEEECPNSPILTPSGKGWNGRNMHHIDLHHCDNGIWLACVDGYHLD